MLDSSLMPGKVDISSNKLLPVEQHLTETETKDRHGSLSFPMTMLTVWAGIPGKRSGRWTGLRTARRT